MTTTQISIDQKCINTIRFLSVDGVQKANSGHPGAPLGASAVVYTLWDKFLKHNPQNPAWFDRDRFVLSAGHASMLLYSMLHLTGYDLPMEELKNFRQWGSKTPGHPEFDREIGIETTTGPLGQGFAHGVGMALAAHRMEALFNKPGFDIVDHFIYALVSDGDLQEGVASEAASLAGTLGLSRLIYLYDDNDIQIEGSTDTNFKEDVKKRFEAYGWQVLGPVDGYNVKEIERAIKEAQADSEKPSLIICKTKIGYGSPLENSEKSHGSPLGEENIKATKKNLGWEYKDTFYVPGDVQEYMKKAVERGNESESRWNELFKKYEEKYPEEAAELKDRVSGKFIDGWEKDVDALFTPDSKPIATRAASGKVLNALAKKVPQLMGGSADLAPSNKTMINGEEEFSKENQAGRNIHFGVREHAMGSICNGMALHGGFIPYSGTFMVFADYMRPPMRLAAMMGIQVVYIFTHDSIGLGEDGPTHQPIEQVMNLRAVPNLNVIRPSDATETVEAWKSAVLNKTGPTVMVLTRQNIPVFDRKKYAPATGLHKGAYTVWQSGEGKPELIIIATGSEVEIALEAAEKLGESGKNVRVVSMPCWKLFDKQPDEYKEEVLPSDVTHRIAIEAGITMGWERYVGLKGRIIGMNSFGASAPYKTNYEKFGITSGAIIEAAGNFFKG